MAVKPLLGAGLDANLIMGIIVMVGGLILQILQKKAGVPDLEPDEAPPEPKPLPRRRKPEPAPPKPKVVEKPRIIAQRPSPPPPQRARALSAARRQAATPLLVSPAMMRDNLQVRRSLAMKVILDRPRCESF
ncbi:MAG: hypothetical protein RL095_2375 [Verrucomicrobiota bacterium]|jgi:pyruvate/2-oxoglutarate dehydrogenase complex dihydrolipoamide acyltransferase (E2) component